MANIALVCPPLPGHLNPTAILGRALQRRGHSVSVFHIPAVESQVRSQHLDFRPVGSSGTDALAARIRQMALLSGFGSLKFAVDCSRDCSDLLCRNLPAALQESAIDLVIADQNEPAAGSVAEHLGLPFVNICPSLPLNREPDIPPPFFGWPFRATAWARVRNRIGYQIANRLISPINKTINGYRRSWGLPDIHTPDQSFSRLAQLCQITAAFDFPRCRLPACFHYLGPFVEREPAATPFPFERLNGKPLIYASLGTLQNRNSRLFHAIAEACRDLHVQLVLSLGGSDANQAMDLPGSPLVVKYAPQLDVLARASLTITHAGLNTVMQSLLFGVPIVALPITHDQPAIAARVERCGAGQVIPATRAKVSRLRAAVERVLNDPLYRTRASEMSAGIQSAGGVERAAMIVEEVLHAFRHH